MFTNTTTSGLSFGSNTTASSSGFKFGNNTPTTAAFSFGSSTFGQPGTGFGTTTSTASIFSSKPNINSTQSGITFGTPATVNAVSAFAPVSNTGFGISANTAATTSGITFGTPATVNTMSAFAPASSTGFGISANTAVTTSGITFGSPATVNALSAFAPASNTGFGISANTAATTSGVTFGTPATVNAVPAFASASNTGFGISVNSAVTTSGITFGSSFVGNTTSSALNSGSSLFSTPAASKISFNTPPTCTSALSTSTASTLGFGTFGAPSTGTVSFGTTAATAFGVPNTSNVLLGTPVSTTTGNISTGASGTGQPSLFSNVGSVPFGTGTLQFKPQTTVSQSPGSFASTITAATTSITAASSIFSAPVTTQISSGSSAASQAGVSFGIAPSTSQTSLFGSFSGTVGSNAFGTQGTTSTGFVVSSAPTSSVSGFSLTNNAPQTSSSISGGQQTQGHQFVPSLPSGFAFGTSTTTTASSTPDTPSFGFSKTIQAIPSFSSPITSSAVTSQPGNNLTFGTFTSQAAASLSLGTTTTQSVSAFTSVAPTSTISFDLTGKAAVASTTVTTSVTTAATTTTMATLFGTVTSTTQSGGIISTTTSSSSFGWSTTKTTTPSLTFMSPNLSQKTATTGATTTTTTTTTTETATESTSKGLGGAIFASSSQQVTTSTAVTSVNDNVLPNELRQTVKMLKDYVNTQKNISSRIARLSIKPMSVVCKQADELLNSVLALDIKLTRQRQIAEKIKDNTLKCMCDVEIAEKLFHYPPSVDHFNACIRTYFLQRIFVLERKAETLEREVEETHERILNLPDVGSLSAYDLKHVMAKLHDSFMAISAIMLKVHNEIQLLKVQTATVRNRYYNNDDKNSFGTNELSRIIVDKSKTINSTSAADSNLFGSISDMFFSALLPTPKSSLDGFASNANSVATVFSKPTQGLNMDSSSLFGITQSPTQLELQKPPLGYKRGKR